MSDHTVELSPEVGGPFVDWVAANREEAREFMAAYGVLEVRTYQPLQLIRELGTPITHDVPAGPRQYSLKLKAPYDPGLRYNVRWAVEQVVKGLPWNAPAVASKLHLGGKEVGVVSGVAAKPTGYVPRIPMIWPERKVTEYMPLGYGPPELEQILGPFLGDYAYIEALLRYFNISADQLGVAPPDPYATHRRKLEASAVERPGVPPSAEPAKYVSSIDEDHWIPDAEPEGIVPRPKGGLR